MFKKLVLIGTVFVCATSQARVLLLPPPPPPIPESPKLEVELYPWALTEYPVETIALTTAALLFAWCAWYYWPEAPVLNQEQQDALDRVRNNNSTHLPVVKKKKSDKSAEADDAASQDPAWNKHLFDAYNQFE